MAKKDQKKVTKFQSTMKEALATFDLKKFKSWLQKYNKPLWNTFKTHDEVTQMGAMCKMICNRTDLLGSEAHKKAVNWLKENNMKGGLF